SPRLKRMLVSVAVLIDLSLSRVCGLSLLMASRQSSSVDVRLAHGSAEVGLQEVEIAAFVRLLDVLRERVAVAAPVVLRRRWPLRPAARHLRIGDFQADAARLD